MIEKLIILNGGYNQTFSVGKEYNPPTGKIVEKISKYDFGNGYYVTFSDNTEVEIPFTQNVLVFTKQ